MPTLKTGFRALAVALVAVGLSAATLVATAGTADAAPARHHHHTKTIIVQQRGVYVANLCLKNISKHNITKCTGKVPAGSVRDLTIRYNRGDRLEFIVAVVGGHNGYYPWIAPRDHTCWSDGTSLSPGAYCRPS
jgi:hypothetical protein